MLKRIVRSSPRLAQLTDYLEGECHPRTRAALETASENLAPEDRATLAMLKSLLEARMESLSTNVFPRIRALEVDRDGVRSTQERLQDHLDVLEREREEILEVAWTLPVRTWLMGPIEHQLEVEQTLVSRATDLETGRRPAQMLELVSPRKECAERAA